MLPRKKSVDLDLEDNNFRTLGNSETENFRYPTVPESAMPAYPRGSQ